MKHQWAILLSSQLKDPWLKEKCLQLTYSNLQIYKPTWGYTVDQILKKLEPGTTHLTIVKMGCHIDNPEAFCEVTTSLFGVYGQILDFDGEYPFFHDQLITLSIEYWRSLGSPTFDQSSTTMMLSNYEASVEKWHDHYTPKHLTQKPGHDILLPRLGSQVISAMLRTHGICMGLSEKLRNEKLYLYPHHGNENNLKKCWTNFTFNELQNENHRRFFEIYFKPKYHQQYFWPYNTEKQEPRGPIDRLKIDRIFSPASGFLAEDLIIENDLSSIQEISFFDINPIQLKFKRELTKLDQPVSDYKLFVDDFIKRNDLPKSRRYHEVEPDLISKINLRLPEYRSLWRKMKRIEFKEIDLISPANEMCFSNFENCIIHFSNVYLFLWNHIRYTYNEVFQSQKRILENLKGLHASFGAILEPSYIENWNSMLLELKKLPRLDVEVQTAHSK